MSARAWRWRRRNRTLFQVLARSHGRREARDMMRYAGLWPTR